ncbi:hypothetical protein BV898_19451 [Hypsibius exemplaris]|uniref:Uncharacterized protein n=1 Tax=Hypsibius exemplaris TaxID=2072580 RepID=A0A9X6NLP0_HYPEX|nr:hypothetical protein BV898_19451 [Hypsibius exemplaris]
MYNLDAYVDIKQFGRGMPVTHHDDLDRIVSDRCDKAKIRPFQYLLELLGETLIVKAEENDSTIEKLFRFVYIYEKKYARDRLAFINQAALDDFESLV